ncbi:hypothetical protein [Actinoplanes rectilineatus]|uniref:hypothetical protein n=1 Tax=Actinoplanes rectilineatus TaxID=113571 RepID=UPI0005F29ACA|nr:hypothetical protein [Actinoplanes rectilineatus]
MTTIQEKLDAARLPERTISICLRGDLVAEHEIADAELEQLQKQPVQRLGGDGRAALRERIRALEAEMAEATEVFRLRAPTRRQYRALVAAHPPRRNEKDEVDEADQVMGLDRSTFFEALMRVSTISPDMGVDIEAYFKELIEAQDAGADLPKPPQGDWPKLIDVLTDKQYGDFTDAAWYLSRGEIKIPFSRAASLTNPSTARE